MAETGQTLDASLLASQTENAGFRSLRCSAGLSYSLFPWQAAVASEKPPGRLPLRLSPHDWPDSANDTRTLLSPASISRSFFKNPVPAAFQDPLPLARLAPSRN